MNSRLSIILSDRHRHLLTDLHSLLPHSRLESKLDTKSNLSLLNELADLYNCNNIVFFEARKATDLYLWISKPPNGPTFKFHVQNLHTMAELHFTGNCLRGSRPILSFDKNFSTSAHSRLMQEMLSQIFGVPRSSRKTKPFVDHVCGFTLDQQGRVWIRVYQVNETDAAKSSEPGAGGSLMEDVEEAKGKKGVKETHISLVEIGPRFILTPIIVQEGSFGGAIIYENKEYVSPNQVRSDIRKARAGRHNARTGQKEERRFKMGEVGLSSASDKKKPRDELDDRKLFA